jgi:hypothetical protein
MYNSEGRVIQANELTTDVSKKDQDEAVSQKQKQKQDSKSQNGSGKKRDFKGGKGKNGKKPFVQRRVKGSVRRTATTPSGILDKGKDSSSTITISMKDKDNNGESESEDDQGDNDTTAGQDEKSVTADKPPKKKKKKSKRKQLKTIKAKLHRNPDVSQRGRMRKEKPRGIIDPGTKIDVIGRPGWHVLSKIDNMNAQLDGALTGMGKCSLPLVSAVTAYDHRLLGTVLLGAGYDERSIQTESLFNSHDFRKHYVIVHDTTKRDGGEQRLEVDGIHVDLDFVDNKTLLFKLQIMPTASELEELKVHWLSPRRLGLKSKNGNAMRCSPAAVVPTQAPWKERLGNPPEEITKKTLQAMTHLCESPVEMDKREAPRQHRKKRVQAFHPKRIEGRTDSDTFFLSIKSVRGYACIQIFFVCLHKFTFVRGMR